jgi:NADPH:quinone reductase-like Zn-dependent oxidoreductase
MKIPPLFSYPPAIPAIPFYSLPAVVCERYGRPDILELKDVAKAGEFKPVIDRRYLLEQIADTHHYMDTGRKS